MSEAIRTNQKTFSRGNFGLLEWALCRLENGEVALETEITDRHLGSF